MRNFYVRCQIDGLRFWLVLFALAAFSLTGHAQSLTVPPGVAVGDSAFQRFISQSTGGANRIYLNATSSLPQSVPSISTANSPVMVARNVALAGPTAARFEIKALSAIPPAKVARLLLLSSKLLPLVSIGVAMYDIARELGFTVSKDNSTGELVYTRDDPNICTVAPCYAITGFDGKSYSSAKALVSGHDASLTRSSTCSSSQPYALYVHDIVSYDPLDGHIVFHYAYCGNNQVFSDTHEATYGAAQTAPPAPAGSGSSSTPQAFEDAVAAVETWGPNSRISQAVADAVKLLPASPELQPGTPVVTGPASTPVKTVTTTSTDGSSLTKTTVDRHSYTGDTVTTKQEETSVKYDPATNTTNTSVTSTIDHSVQTGVSAGPGGSTAAPETPTPPEDLCKANPGRLGCMEAGTPPAAEVLPNKTISFALTPVVFASSEVCPADLGFSVMGRVYAISFAPLCDGMRIVKAIVLLLSGLMAAFIIADSFRISS